MKERRLAEVVFEMVGGRDGWGMVGVERMRV